MRWLVGISRFDFPRRLEEMTKRQDSIMESPEEICDSLELARRKFKEARYFRGMRDRDIQYIVHINFSPRNAVRKKTRSLDKDVSYMRVMLEERRDKYEKIRDCIVRRTKASSGRIGIY